MQESKQEQEKHKVEKGQNEQEGKKGEKDEKQGLKETRWEMAGLFHSFNAS